MVAVAVEVGVGAGVGADADGGPQVVAEEPVGHRRRSLRCQQRAAQEVPGVRGDDPRDHPVAPHGQGVGAFVGHPEDPLERPGVQVHRLGDVDPQAGQGGGGLGVVALHLHQRHRGHDRHRTQVRVPPPLVEQTGPVPTLVGHEVREADPGRPGHPGRSARQVGGHLLEQGEVAGARHVAVHQADPPRRAVDAAVVREPPGEPLPKLETHPIGRANRDLVGDLARLLLPSTVVHPALVAGQGPDGGGGDRGVLGQHLERRDAGVSAEQASEAGQAGLVPAVGRAQPGQVVARPGLELDAGEGHGRAPGGSRR